jgi:uncharacterized protein
MNLDLQEITARILLGLPDTQAIYLFGSYASGDARPESDVDIALLLPPRQARELHSFYSTSLHRELQEMLSREVDLINLRQVPTVFQKEVVMGGKRIDCRDQYEADEFEMLVLSFYQKLNEERADVMTEGLRSGRFY